MVMCSKCYSDNCKCNVKKVEIDDSIFEVISNLNKKGFYTCYCCGGHIDEEAIKKGVIPNIYIAFGSNEIEKYVSLLGIEWVYNRTDHVLRYVLGEAGKYKRYMGKNKTLMRRYNQLLTRIELEEMEDELEARRGELKNWVQHLG